MDLDASMSKSLESTQRTFNTIRTGRANPSLLDKVSVEYYGADTPLKSLATISTPDAQTIQIQPFDGSAMGLIEKAISLSDLGLTPNNDGKVIRINIPPLTEERRKEFCKLAAKYAEEGKVALRNVRRDAIDRIKKQEKDGDLSEDQSRDEQEKVQKVTDKFITQLEKLLAEKEKDILKVCARPENRTPRPGMWSLSAAGLPAPPPPSTSPRADARCWCSNSSACPAANPVAAAWPHPCSGSFPSI